MSTIQVEIPYYLSFRSAFHFGTGLREGLIHRAVARDTKGFLYVPGSTFKGVVRDRCEQLARLFSLEVIEPHARDDELREVHPETDIITRIFGSRFHPSQLYFDDSPLVDEQQEWFMPPAESAATSQERRLEFRTWQTEKRTQVSLSRLTRTAKARALYNSEYGIRGLKFTGTILGLLSGTPLPDSEGNYPLLLLVAGLLSLDSIGGNKSTGGGTVECEIVDDQLQVDGQPMSISMLLDQLGYLDADFYNDWRKESKE